jgi:thiamine biosynthesis lipoprotein
VDLLELVDRRWRTDLVLSLRGHGVRRHEATVREVFACEVERLERAASRFRPDSELSAANDWAGRWVPASPLLVELVEVAIAAAHASGGLVNPCLGRHVDAAGYRTWSASEVMVGAVLPDRSVEVDPHAWQRLEVGPDCVRVPAGAQLDLGATAKAWLADELAERLAEQTGLDVVANMGGDLRAIGTRPWVVGVEHAAPGAPPAALEVLDAGLATSGIGHRRWLTTDGPAHHLIDPRTGASAVTRWWAASVLAATATAANTAATAAVLLDARGPQWLERRGLSAVLTAWSGAGPASRVEIGAWPAEDAA